jgi:hypothetical protein
MTHTLENAPLDADLRDLLDADTSPLVVEPGIADAIWSRVSASTSAPAPPSTVAPRGVPSQAPRLKRIAGGVGLAVAALIGIGTQLRGPRPEPAAVETKTEPHNVAPASRDEASDGDAASSPPGERVEARDVERSSVSPAKADPLKRMPRKADVAASRTPEAPPAPLDRAEAKAASDPEDASVLMRARAALSQKDPAGALALLSNHAERFPHSRLAEERAALRVLALLQEAPHDGEKAAEAFLASHPHSVFRHAIESSRARQGAAP